MIARIINEVLCAAVVAAMLLFAMGTLFGVWA